MNSTYGKDHKLAKLIISTIVGILITAAQLSEMPWSIGLNLAAVYVWFFGVNPMGYLIESVKRHPHSHDKI